jgi:hypothetical protein
MRNGAQEQRDAAQQAIRVPLWEILRVRSLFFLLSYRLREAVALAANL